MPQVITQPTNYTGLAGWCQEWFNYLTSPNYPATKRITVLESQVKDLTKRIAALEKPMSDNDKIAALTGQLKASGDALVAAEQSINPV